MRKNQIIYTPFHDASCPSPFHSPKRLVFKILPEHTTILVVDEIHKEMKGKVLRKGRAAWEQYITFFRTSIGVHRFGQRDVNNIGEMPAMPPQKPSRH
jgi:hypothetical protein